MQHRQRDSKGRFVKSTPKRKAPVKAATPKCKAPVKAAAPKRKAPVKAAAPKRKAPVKAAAPKRKAPVKAAAPKRKAPVKAAAPKRKAPVKAAAPKRKAPVKAAAPKRKAPVKAAAPKRKAPVKAAAPERDRSGRFVPRVDIETELSFFWPLWLGPDSDNSVYLYPGGKWESEGKVRTDMFSYVVQIALIAENYPPKPPRGVLTVGAVFVPSAVSQESGTQLIRYGRRGGGEGLALVNQKADTNDREGVFSVMSGLSRMITNVIESTKTAQQLVPTVLLFRLTGSR